MTLRPPRLDEAANVAALFEGELPDPVSPDLIRTAWTTPSFDLTSDARVGVAGDGELSGYADAELVGDDTSRVYTWAVGEPAEELAQWADGRAGELVRPPARAFASVWSENERGRHRIEARGFRLVRHFYRMAIDLEVEPAAPAWPDGVGVRTFASGDERTFYEVHQESFEDHWEHVRRSYDAWAHWMLAPERHHPELWFVADADGEPAGIAICRPDAMQDGVGWVDVLGVRRPWRKRGLGRALLLHAFREFRRRGFREVVLGVDAESPTGAVRLYEQAGMRVVHRFDSYEKQLA